MDTSSIGALTGTADTGKKKKQAGGGDADAFASVMGQASEADSEGGKKADLISKEESAKEKADKSDASKKREVEKDNKEARAEAKVEHKKSGKIDDFLKNIATKDPATLSMAERQMANLGEFSSHGKKNVGGMAQMLASQGIDMSSFSPQQLMSLVSRMDTKELGKLMSGMKAAGLNFDEESVKKLKEQLNAQQNQQQTAKEPANFNLQDFASAGMPKEAGESARAEQRRMVMDQILSNIQVRNVANQTEMQLRLNPEYLGEVKISLVHDEEGGIKATFQTTSKVTREVLAENKDSLIDEARDRGVRIGSMDVEFVDEITA